MLFFMLFVFLGLSIFSFYKHFSLMRKNRIMSKRTKGGGFFELLLLKIY